MAGMKDNKGGGGLVYSTEAGRMCPVCRRAAAQCSCAAERRRAASGGGGAVQVSRETKGRGGKTVTLVRGLALEEAALAKLAQQLKAACGSGGTVKDGVVEVQGEHRERIAELLQAQGHRVRRG
jgi:translation initiation factor 1